MSWLLSIVIYLSVNGQVFSTPIHLCQAMAKTSITSLTSSDTLNIHQHHQMDEQASLVNNTEKLSEQSSMDNCQCIECDCTPNMVSQANSSMVSKEELIVFSLNVEHVLIKREITFISQPYSNVYRPPISI